MLLPAACTVLPNMFSGDVSGETTACTMFHASAPVPASVVRR